ncbi:hypothetical protein [Pseudorhodobacter ferrugineus]|uniref:hypothetical protein n=1 Tax=Pseudorhodobacter ferrugineus TaxID=77008 RepID=UPI0018CEBEAC|nr:hypothetical protein [Pseudorhodobacter ferrugineus]
MAHLLAWAKQRGETASSLLEMPFYYPTLEAGLKPALRAICQASTGGFPVNQDDSDPPGSWAPARGIERRRFRRTSRTARVKGCGSRDKTGKRTAATKHVPRILMVKMRGVVQRYGTGSLQ